MAGGMGAIRSVGKYVLPVGGTIMLAAATTKPDDAISNLSGWADKVVGYSPSWLSNPNADNWGIWIGAALLAAALVTWTAPWAARLVRDRKWWYGKVRFTIPEAACLLCGLRPSQFDMQERAKALANDILGGVRNGMIRIDGEAWVTNNIGLALGPNPSKYPKKPDATLDTLIGKNTLEGFAKNRGFKLPWPLSKTD